MGRIATRSAAGAGANKDTSRRANPTLPRVSSSRSSRSESLSDMMRGEWTRGSVRVRSESTRAVGTEAAARGRDPSRRPRSVTPREPPAGAARGVKSSPPALFRLGKNARLPRGDVASDAHSPPPARASSGRPTSLSKRVSATARPPPRLSRSSARARQRTSVRRIVANKRPVASLRLTLLRASCLAT